MPRTIQGEQCDLQSFDSPLSVYGLESNEFYDSKNLLDNIMRLFQKGIDGDDIKYINKLYTEEDPKGNKLIDALSEPVLKAGIGLDPYRRPTVAEVMELANNIKIIEADGSVVTYAEKFFDNKTIDMLVHSENTSKKAIPAYGSLMAIHIGLFLGMKSYKELDSFEGVFADKHETKETDSASTKKDMPMFGNLIPGMSKVNEPPRVFITIPGQKPKAVVGSNLMDLVDDISVKNPNEIGNKIDKIEQKIAYYNNKIVHWKSDLVTLRNSLQRKEKEHSESIAKLELAQKNGQENYDKFKRDFNEAEAGKIRDNLAAAEEKKYQDFETKYLTDTYNPKRTEIKQQIADFKQRLETQNANEPGVPPEPTEGFFRRILMFFGAGHSNRYLREESLRNTAIENHDAWQATKESLESSLEESRNKLETLKRDKTKAFDDKRKEIDAAKNNLPSIEKIMEDEEKKKREEYIDKPARDYKDYKEKNNIEKERKETLDLIDRWEAKTSRAEREMKQLTGRKDFVFGAVSDIEQSKDFANLTVKEYFKASNNIIKQLTPNSKDMKRSINQKFNNPDVQDEILSNKSIGTLEQGACVEMLKVLNLPETMRSYRREYSLPHNLGRVFGLMFPDDVPRIVKDVKIKEQQEARRKPGKNEEPFSAEKYTGKATMAVYENKVKGSMEAFKHYFGLECNVENIKKVMTQIDFEKSFNDRLKNFDRPNEYDYGTKELKDFKLPEVNKRNYKEMTVLLMAGVKTAVKKARVKEEVQHVKAQDVVKGKEAEVAVPKEKMSKGHIKLL